MLKFLTDSIETYFEAWKLILVLGFIVFAVLIFLSNFMTYVIAGAGFISYETMLSGSLDLPYLILLVFLSLVSLFCLSFLAVGVTMIVKLKRSLDDTEFFKLIARFPRYSIKLLLWWIVLGAITFVVLFIFHIVQAPSWFSALAMLFLWAFFIFIPQSLVLQEKGFFASLRESAKYCVKRPAAVLVYYSFSCFFLLILVSIDVIFGQFFFEGSSISWIAAIINSALLFIFFIPLLEIIKANVFVTRYKLLTVGLK